VSPLTTSVFDLPGRLAGKADPALIAGDERHFAAIAESLEQSIADLADRLDAERKAPGGIGQKALDRDLEVHRLTGRLRALRRFGLDLCLGRVVAADQPGPVYIGRLGLRDSAGRQLLVDWRSPAAEPFFGATHANPMGLASRRRYRWTGGRISDYWDEVFTPGGLEGHAALDDQSAFIASLGASRSPRMRDVLSTIAADQDAIIRAGSAGALVVDGGPGTGKTVVALHRTAYLLYSDPRVAHRRGGVLFVGPHQHYLAYVADVLPSLGEEGVQTATLAGAAALPAAGPDPLAGPFAHIVVDEAQELTDAEWQMLLARCPSRSFTIVGDRAQARHGFTESWQERLHRIGLEQINLASLTINYRTPEEVMTEAEPVIRAVLPDANVPVSIRSTGLPVLHGPVSDLGPILGTWLAAHAEGIACVIGDPAFRASPRVRSLPPELTKGLEFDLVVLIDPEAFGTGIEGAVDRYVAMTRATQRLVILTSP